MRASWHRVVFAAVCGFVMLVTLVARSGAEIDFGALRGAWPLDENSGDVAHDASGNGNDGTLRFGPTWVEGVFGSALDFDGVDDLVHMPSDAGDDLNPKNSITMALWVFWKNPGQVELMLGRMDTAESRTFYVAMVGGGLQMEISHDGTTGDRTIIDPLDALPGNEWHHLAGTYDTASDTYATYVDGEPAGKEPNHLGGPGNTGIHQNDSDVYMSFDKVDGGFQFTGTIDEVAIFDVALSQDDVQDLMEMSLSETLAVSPTGKLATTWASLKKRN